MNAIQSPVTDWLVTMKPPPSADTLVTIQLRNAAHLSGTASKRFAVVAAMYAVPLADATARALRALDAKGLTDASATKAA
jgi:hypothetical protein